jgi:hypothetical protein
VRLDYHHDNINSPSYMPHPIAASAELLLNALSLRKENNHDQFALVLQRDDNTAFGSTDVYLSSKLRFGVDASSQEVCYVQSDGEEVGVMMGWEREISVSLLSFNPKQNSTNWLCPSA